MRLCKNCQINIEHKNKGAIFCCNSCKTTHNHKILRRTNDDWRIKTSEYYKKWYQKNKERQAENIRNYYINHKEKSRERSYVNNSLKFEFFKTHEKICSECGSSENIELHHKDYKKYSNNIEILCRNCHRRLHRQIITI